MPQSDRTAEYRCHLPVVILDVLKLPPRSCRPVTTLSMFKGELEIKFIFAHELRKEEASTKFFR